MTPCLRDSRSIDIDISVDLLPSSIYGKKWLWISSMMILLPFSSDGIIAEEGRRINLIFAIDYDNITLSFLCFCIKHRGLFYVPFIGG